MPLGIGGGMIPKTDDVINKVGTHACRPINQLLRWPLKLRSGGGFDTSVKYKRLQFLFRMEGIKICPHFLGQLSYSGTQNEFWLRPVFIKHTNLQKSSTGNLAHHSLTVLLVEHRATKGQSHRLLSHKSATALKSKNKNFVDTIPPLHIKPILHFV